MFLKVLGLTALVGATLAQTTGRVNALVATSATITGQSRCAMSSPYSWEKIDVAFSIRNETPAAISVAPASAVVSRVLVATSTSAMSRKDFEFGTDWDLPLSGEPQPKLVRLPPGGSIKLAGVASVLVAARPTPGPPKAAVAGSHVLGLEISFQIQDAGRLEWRSLKAPNIEVVVPRIEHAALPQCK